MDTAELEEEIQRVTQEVLDEAGYNGPPVASMSDAELKALYEISNPDVIAEIDRRIAGEYGVRSVPDLEVHGEALIPPIGRIFVGAVRAAPTVVTGLGRGAASLAAGLGRRIGLLSDDALRATGGMGRGTFVGSGAAGRFGAGGGAAHAAGQGTLPGMQAANAGRITAGAGAAAGSGSWLKNAIARHTPSSLRAAQNLSPHAKRIILGSVGAVAGAGLLSDATNNFGLDADEEDLPESGDVTMDAQGSTITRDASSRVPNRGEEVIDTEPAGNSMYNSIYWEGHTINSANDKFMNFVTGKHIPVGVSTFQSAAESMGMQVQNIRSGPMRAQFEEHILANWERFPRFKRAVMEKLSRRLTDYQEANHWRTVDTSVMGRGAGAMTGMIRQQPMLEGPIAIGEPLSVEHRAVVEAMLAEGIGNIGDLEGFQTPTGPQGGSYGTMLDQFKALDEEFGAGSADQALSGIIDEAMTEYVDKYTRTNPSMLMYQDQEGISTGYLTEFDLTENSYDGTPGGSVFSLMDLFSGPLGLKVGPAYNRAHLDDKFAQTQVGGISNKIAEYQQAIYAMGYFVNPRDGKEYLPATWGVVDELTANAISRIQIDIAANYANAEDLGLNPDVNKIYMQMQNQSTANLHHTSAMEAPNPAQVYKAAAMEEIKAGIDRALSDRGVSLARGGNDIYMDTVTEVLNSMTPGERETAYGQGGSPEDRAGALHILDSLTGGNYTEFGAMGNEQSFINYANRVGALSEEEMENISRFNTHPDHIEQLQNERGQDVAVANFMMFLDKPVAQASREEIRNAAIMYANTVGMGTVGKAGLTVDMIRQRIDTGYDSLYQAPIDQASGDLLDTLEDRVANAMGVNEKGIGGGRYSNLLGVLNQSYSTGRASG